MSSTEMRQANRSSEGNSSTLQNIVGREGEELESNRATEGENDSLSFGANAESSPLSSINAAFLQATERTMMDSVLPCEDTQQKKRKMEEDGIKESGSENKRARQDSADENAKTSVSGENQPLTLSPQHIVLARIPGSAPLNAAAINKATLWFGKLLTEGNGIDMLEIQRTLGLRIYQEENLAAYHQLKDKIELEKASKDALAVKGAAGGSSSVDNRPYTLRLVHKGGKGFHGNRYYTAAGEPRTPEARAKLEEKDAAGEADVYRVYE